MDGTFLKTDPRNVPSPNGTHFSFLSVLIVALRKQWRPNGFCQRLLLAMLASAVTAWAAGSPAATASASNQTLPRFVSVSTSGLQTAAVDADGGLWAWGGNGYGPYVRAPYGPFGNDPNPNKALPTRVAGTGFAQVAMLGDEGFAIKTNGTLWAWGRNAQGTFGDGTKLGSAVPRQVASGFVRLAGNYAHVVGLKGDGSLWTWGSNEGGVLGDDTPATGRTSPKQIGSGFVSISMQHAIKADGSLWAWGDLQGGFTGFRTVTRLTHPTQIATGFAAVSYQNAYSHALALKEDGSLWAWGANHWGQLGDGTASSIAALAAKQIGSGYSTVLASGSSSVALKPDGSLWTWGFRPNFRGISSATELQRLTPEQVGAGFDSLGTSTNSAGLGLAIRVDGSLWAWGDGINGNLGDDFGLSQRPLTIKQVGSGFASMAAGQLHSVAVQTDGSLWAWGVNMSGQVGNGTAVAVPAMEKIGSDFMAVAAGGTYLYPAPPDGFSVGLKKDGSVWTWGGNSRGQLGTGSLANALVPQQVATGFSAIAAGNSHAVALKPDGTVWAWGANDLGQLGDKTTQDRSQPVRAAFDFLGYGPSYSAIAAGGNHTLALRPDGSLWAWGSNSAGQLGIGNTQLRNHAVLVGEGYKAMAAGKAHSLGLKTDGTLWAWGKNSGLGDGGTDDVLRPKRIMDGVIAVAAGEFHSLAIKTDGTLWAWGTIYDYLGLCTDLCSNSLYVAKLPTQIGSGYIAIASGANHALALKANGSLWAWGAPGGSQPSFSAVPKPVGFAKVFTRQSQTDCLFDWAAKVAPALFSPAGGASVDLSAGRYRYFEGSQSYLAVTHENRQLFYLDAGSMGALTDLGEAANWVTTAGCD